MGRHAASRRTMQAISQTGAASVSVSAITMPVLHTITASQGDALTLRPLHIANNHDPGLCSVRGVASGLGPHVTCTDATCKQGQYAICRFGGVTYMHTRCPPVVLVASASCSMTSALSALMSSFFCAHTDAIRFSTVVKLGLP